MSEDRKDGQEPFVSQSPAPPVEPTAPTAAAEPPKPARPDFFELLYGILFTPRKAIRQAAENPPFTQALVVFFVVNILSTIVTTVSLGTALSSRIFASAPAAFIVAGLIVGFIDWFVVTAIFHLLAELFGGRGRGLALFTLIALVNLPRLVNVPLALLSLTPLRSLGVLLNLAVVVWVAILYVIAISEVHHISTGQSIGVLLMPLGAAIVALITIIVAFAGVAAKLIPLFEKGSPLFPGL